MDEPTKSPRIPIGSFDNERIVNGVPMLPVRDVDLPPTAQVYDDVRAHDGKTEMQGKLAHISNNEWYVLHDKSTAKPMG